MDTEEQLSELMENATRALAPHVGELVAEAGRRGRRLRARRRIAVAGTTAVVVAVAVTGTVLAGGAMAGPEQSQVADGGGTPTASSPANATPPPGPTPSSSASAGPSSAATATGTMPAITPPTDVSPSGEASQTSHASGTIPSSAIAILAVLKRLLPPGFTAVLQNGANTEGPGGFDFDINDGHGVSMVFVDVVEGYGGLDPVDCSQQGTPQNGSARPVGAPPTSCTVVTFPNGDKAMEQVTGTDQASTYMYRVITNRADGLGVEVEAANGDWSSPATEDTRPTPPLNLGEWAAIALSSEW